MRTSNDEYKTKEGDIISISQDTIPPEGAIVWNGYDYKNQMWVFEGKKDTRTIEELKLSLNN
jgi:hypothetical protein